MIKLLNFVISSYLYSLLTLFWKDYCMFNSFREMELRYITAICRSLFLSNVPKGLL